jgi:hypothetical protein
MIYGRSFVPKDFVIPPGLKTDRLKLRMLTIKDVEKDYSAVMNSRKHIYGVFGPDDDWPNDELTFEQDLIDLGWHQKEFQKRNSFTYAVVNLDSTDYLGCVYLYPSGKEDFDMEVYLWVTKEEFENGLDEHLFETVKNWIKKDWPFKKVAYPGRDISWEDWQKLE